MKGEEGLKESLKERINVRTSTGQGAVIKATADLKRKGKRIIGEPETRVLPVSSV